ncbi:hypothetical protein [Massilia sp. TS11]|uniref:hypothetical protein n=1 Tax=Massilia sp. TS11 TaxID=2908003 RepID=UPI001EDBC0B7|nr:hypothetical protein [Massilia sp. TS11]MCG2585742.1 hypothetical protein [Massilia sp. TS11]
MWTVVCSLCVALPLAAPLPAARLAQIRGGALAPPALQFSVTRAIAADGQWLAQARWQGQAGAAGLSLSGPPGLGAPLLIQNAADGRQLQSLTTLDVQGQTLSELAGLRLQASLQAAATAALTR